MFLPFLLIRNYKSGVHPGGPPKWNAGGFAPGGFAPGGFTPGCFAPGGFASGGFAPRNKINSLKFGDLVFSHPS